MSRKSLSHPREGYGRDGSGASAFSAVRNHVQGPFVAAAIASATLAVGVIRPVVSGNLLVNITVAYTQTAATTFNLVMTTGAWTLNGTANALVAPAVYGTQPLVLAGGTGTAFIVSGVIATTPNMLSFNMLMPSGIINLAANPGVAVSLSFANAGTLTIPAASAQMSIVEVG